MNFLRSLFVAALAFAALPGVDAQSAGWLPLVQVSGGGGGGTLTFAIDATNFAGQWSTATLPLVCPSAACPVTGSSSTPFGIGGASANRNVIASFGYGAAGLSPNGIITGVMFNGTVSGSSCVGGIAATKAFDTNFNGGFNATDAIWYAPVPTGTTATVCFTAVGGNGWGGSGVIHVATINDSLGASSMSVASTKISVPPAMPGSCAGSVCTNTWSSTVIPTGGIGVASALDSNSTLVSSSWSGATKQAETFDGANSTVTLATWSASGTVTETAATGGIAGFGGVIFSPSPVWTPASEPNLLAWWKADAGLTCTSGCSSGNAVTAWADQSGHGYTLATGGSSPTYLPTGLNGNPTLSFAAASTNYLITATGVAMGTGTSNACFAVVTYNPGSMASFGRGFSYAPSGGGDVDPGATIWFIRDGSNSNFNAFNSGTGGTPYAVSAATAVHAGAVFTGSLVTPYLNGTAQATHAMTTSNVNGGLFLLGTSIAGGIASGSPWDGKFTELFCVNGALTGSPTDIENYFSRWN